MSWSFSKAFIVRVVDGDTVILDVDLGFEITRRASFRLLGLNARELHEAGGREAKMNLTLLLPMGSLVTLTSVKNDKFGGRFDAILTTIAGSVNDHLIANHWAAVWSGGGEKTLPPWPRP